MNRSGHSITHKSSKIEQADNLRNEHDDLFASYFSQDKQLSPTFILKSPEKENVMPPALGKTSTIKTVKCHPQTNVSKENLISSSDEKRILRENRKLDKQANQRSDSKGDYENSGQKNRFGKNFTFGKSKSQEKRVFSNSLLKTNDQNEVMSPTKVDKSSEGSIIFIDSYQKDRQTSHPVSTLSDEQDAIGINYLESKKHFRALEKTTAGLQSILKIGNQLGTSNLMKSISTVPEVTENTSSILDRSGKENMNGFYIKMAILKNNELEALLSCPETLLDRKMM